VALRLSLSEDLPFRLLPSMTIRVFGMPQQGHWSLCGAQTRFNAETSVSTGQLHQLTGVEKLTLTVEQFVGYFDRGVAHPDGVVRVILSSSARLIVRERKELFVDQTPLAGDRGAHVDAVLAVSQSGSFDPEKRGGIVPYEVTLR
jgi:hypothetical protein